MEKINAEDVLNMIQDYYNVDLSKNTRKVKYTMLRYLLAYILYYRLGMKDREIADFFTEVVGVKRDRSSLAIGRGKLELSLDYFPYLKDVYNYYMKSEQLANPSDANFVDQRIVDEVKDLTDEQNEEILEVIKLKKKSWEWKSKDEYEIINCQL